MDEIFIDYGIEICFGGKIVLIDLEGLLEVALFQLDKVPVIPRIQRDLTLRMRYFADDTHFKNPEGVALAKVRINPVPALLIEFVLAEVPP